MLKNAQNAIAIDEDAIRKLDANISVGNNVSRHLLLSELIANKKYLQWAKENFDKHLKRRIEETKDDPQIKSISNEIKNLTASINNIENKLQKKEEKSRNVNLIPTLDIEEKGIFKELLRLNSIISDLKSKLARLNNARNAALKSLEEAYSDGITFNLAICHDYI